MIEKLPLLTPDASRHAKTIARCHERLAARRRKIGARHRAPGAPAPGAERLVAAGLCVAYFVALAGDLLAIAARR